MRKTRALWKKRVLETVPRLSPGFGNEMAMLSGANRSIPNCALLPVVRCSFAHLRDRSVRGLVDYARSHHWIIRALSPIGLDS
ncbi:hypothetical protein AVEN_26117-1 [Araneus ventricosus]|uniref:Uncharacterized protein n=1 Tax=Araneus ventricosus TaxID=182803 RepID=A0A4Y2NYZ3_ARAVE|nr:hypothetical protein AVEN_26117-1 [Araneus ventricosus]